MTRPLLAKTVPVALAAASAIAVAGSALGADLGMPTKAPLMAPVPTYNWNGFYIGGHVGYGWGHTSENTFDPAGTLVDSVGFDSSGAFGGGQIGVNYMVTPNWVLGLEADISAADIKGSVSGCSPAGCAIGNTKLDDFGTVRGRIGYAWNNVLFYGTGGWAWGHADANRQITCVVAGGGICPGGPSPSVLTGQIASASGTESGWAAGGGVEWGFLPNWTVKVEYLHLEFDGIGHDYSYPGFPAASRHINADTGIDTVRIGVNYLFNWRSSALSARY
jgi:outer membrane immunogenic protein